MSTNTVESYGWRSSAETCCTSYVAPRVQTILGKLGVRRVADLGSGNGILCKELASKGYDVVGIEYDQDGVDIAKNAYPDIKFYKFGVEDDPNDLLLLEAKFEAVVSTEVVEHLFSPHLLPIYARSILKAGGYLIVTTPYHGYLKNLALSIFDRWDKHHTALWHGGHIKFWSRKTLTELLQKSGFEVQGFSGVGRISFLWKSMVLVAKVI